MFFDALPYDNESCGLVVVNLSFRIENENGKGLPVLIEVRSYI